MTEGVEGGLEEGVGEGYEGEGCEEGCGGGGEEEDVEGREGGEDCGGERQGALVSWEFGNAISLITPPLLSALTYCWGEGQEG